MNKAVNIFSMMTLVIFTMIALTIIFDLAISNIHLKGMSYKYEIMTGISLLFFLIGLLRVKARWQGFKDMKAFKQFNFESKISKTFSKRSMNYTMLEVLFMCGALILFIRLWMLDSNLMISIILVLSILIIEALLFVVALKAKGDSFRIGLNDKVIGYFGREMKLFYYEGLQRVELHQSDLISFKYKGDLVLFMPTTVLEDAEIPKFKAALIEQLDAKNIYFDDRFRNWG